MATIALTMLAETQQMRKGIDSVNDRLGVMGKTVSGVGRMIKGLAVGFIAFKAASIVTNSIKDASAAIAEQDKLLAQTQATLKSTGGAAGVTAKEILGLSDAIEKKSLIDAEQIQAGQNMLLTFTNIRNEAGKGNDIFTQTTKTMADLSTAMGQSTKSSALQLGKALNDPIKGISALSRVGVSFTEDQKKQVAAMVKNNNTMGAQKLILAELNKEFGGSAKAAGDTFAGKVKHLKDVWEGFVESLVRKAIPVLAKVVDFMSKNLPVAIAAGTKAFAKAREALAPYVAQLIAAGQSLAKSLLPALMTVASVLVGTVLPAFKGLVDGLIKYQAVVVPVVAGIVAMVAAYKTYMAVANAVKAVQAAWIGVQIALNVAMTANPIGLIVLALVGLAAALVVAYKKSDTFRAIVDKTFSFLKNAVSVAIDFVKSHWKLILGILIGPIAIAAVLIIKHWDKIKNATKAAWNFVKTIVTTYLDAVKAVISTYLSAYKAVITGAWNVLKTVTKAAWNAFKTIITTEINAAMKIVSAIKSKVTGALSGARTLLLNAGKAIIDGLIDGLETGVAKVEGLLKKITDKIPDWKGPKNRDKKLLSPTGKLIMASLVKGFEDGRDGIKKSLGEVTDLIEKHFDKRFKNDKEAAQRSKAAIKSLANETKALQKNAKKREAIYAKLEKAKDRLDDLKNASKDYAKSVKDALVDYASITNLNTAYTAKGITGGLQARLEKLKQFASLIKRLKAMGVNQTTLDQIVSGGVEGGLAVAQALVTGGQNAVNDINSIQDQINAVSAGIGTTTADALYGAQIKAAEGYVKGLEKQKKRLEAVAENMGKAFVRAVEKALKTPAPKAAAKAVAPAAKTASPVTVNINGPVVGTDKKALANELLRLLQNGDAQNKRALVNA